MTLLIPFNETGVENCSFLVRVGQCSLVLVGQESEIVYKSPITNSVI